LCSFKNYIDIKLAFSYIVIFLGFLFNLDTWQILVSLMVLVFFDFISALFVAKILGEQIESRKSIKSAFKIMIYGIIISSSHLVDKCIGIVDWVMSLEYVSISFLAMTEFISILESFAKAGYVAPKKILNSFRKKIICKDCI